MPEGNQFPVNCKIKHFTGNVYTYLGWVLGTDFHRVFNADGDHYTISTQHLVLHYEEI